MRGGRKPPVLRSDYKSLAAGIVVQVVTLLDPEGLSFDLLGVKGGLPESAVPIHACRLKENTVIAGMRYRSMEATRSGDLRSRTTVGVRRPRRTTGTTTAGSGGFAEQPEDGGVRPSPNEAGLRQPLVFIHGHPLELVERNSVVSLTGDDSSGHRFPPFQDTTGSCEKNSLPLSSTRMKAGKSTTSIL